MTIKELQDYYKNSYQFRKATGMSDSSFQNWLHWGFIPIVSQFKIERLTSGKLKANISHAVKDDPR